MVTIRTVIDASVVTLSSNDIGGVEGNVATGTAKVLMCETLLGTDLQDETRGFFFAVGGGG